MAAEVDQLGRDHFLRIKNAIYRYSLSHESFTIPTIAGLTGFSTTTIAKYVNQMKDNGSLVTLASEDTNKVGRKATIYAIKLDPYYFLGVDVKVFGISFGLMNMNGTMVRIDDDEEYRFDLKSNPIKNLCDKVNSYILGLTDIGKDQISAINFNFRGRVDRGLAENLAKGLGTTCFVENDTNAMAYGEYQSSDQTFKNLLYVYVGWGLGLGIIIDGKLYTGSQGFAGEIGHMPFYDNRVLCHCGKKGCIETEVSISAIQRKLMTKIKEGDASVLSDKVLGGGEVVFSDIMKAMEEEDPLCIEILAETGYELGRILSGMISLFNPDGIMIAGPLTSLPPYFFLEQVMLSIKQYTPRLLNQKITVIPSQLSKDAAVIGACLIARNKSFMNMPESAAEQRKPKSIDVPYIESLEDLEDWKLEATLVRNTAGAAIDVVNWPELYSYAPKCIFRIARSHDYLAVSFSVSGMDLRATVMKDNDRSWEDSCCEFFVSAGEEYYNIEITCIGYIRIGKGTTRNNRELLPNEEVAKVKRWSTLEKKRYDLEGGNYSWSVTMLIPFTVIGLDANNLPRQLRGNFYKCGDHTAHPHFLSWNPVNSEKPDFHRPECFGRLNLS